MAAPPDGILDGPVILVIVVIHLHASLAFGGLLDRCTPHMCDLFRCFLCTVRTSYLTLLLSKMDKCCSQAVQCYKPATNVDYRCT